MSYKSRRLQEVCVFFWWRSYFVNIIYILYILTPVDHNVDALKIIALHISIIIIMITSYAYKYRVVYEHTSIIIICI